MCRSSTNTTLDLLRVVVELLSFKTPCGSIRNSSRPVVPSDCFGLIVQSPHRADPDRKNHNCREGHGSPLLGPSSRSGRFSTCLLKVLRIVSKPFIVAPSGCFGTESCSRPHRALPGWSNYICRERSSADLFKVPPGRFETFRHHWSCRTV